MGFEDDDDLFIIYWVRVAQPLKLVEIDFLLSITKPSPFTLPGGCFALATLRTGSDHDGMMRCS